MKRSLIILLSPFIMLSQTQIGNDIVGEFGDAFGISVSLSSNGSIVAIGAISSQLDTGHVSVYENISGVWTQIGADIQGETIGDRSGEVSLSSDGSIVAIGALLNDGNGEDSGHVRVYENISGVWTQIGADIDGETAGDLSGISLSLSSDGSIVAIGADSNNDNGVYSGHVRVYENISGVWTQIGADIDGEAADDLSGGAVSLSSDGSVVAIGAEENDGNGLDSGHVRIYENISGVWTQIGADIDGEAMDDYSGLSVSLSSDGTIVAIGADYNDGNGLDSGHVRVYENILGVWTQIGADIDGEAAEDYSGPVSLSSDGSVLAIGAAENDGNGTDSGHVRIFKNISGVWTQVGTDINGEAAEDFSGEIISLSSDGNTVAISTYDKDYVRVYDLSQLLSNEHEFLLKALLQGSYDTNTGLMADQLRSSNKIPITSPYTDGLVTSNTVFNTGGTSGSGLSADDIVDWVWLELRNSNDAITKEASTSALIQRDGDVVDVDGISPVTINVSNGNYFIVFSHRNHLGIQTNNTVSFSGGTTSLDLSNDSGLVLGNDNAIKDMGDGKFALYAGDFNGDGQVQNTDKSTVEPLRGLSGYNNADIDMNGEVQNTDINSLLNPNIGKGEQFMSKKLHAKRKK